MTTSPDWKAVREWAVQIITPIMLGVSGYMFTWMLNHERRITSIEASRYTQAHAVSDKDKLYDKLDSIKDSVHSLERNMPSKAEVGRLRETIGKLSERLDRKQ